MSGRKTLQPKKIIYQEAKDFSPEKLEMAYDFLFRKAIEKMKDKNKSNLDTLNNIDIY